MHTYYWKSEDSGIFTLYQGERPILSASAAAKTADGRAVHTRSSVLKECTEKEDGLRLVFESPDGLLLEERLSACAGFAQAQCVLRAADGSEIESRSLTPLIAHGKKDETPYLWRDLRAKMLQVPYDNDMWMRYEAVALRAGRRSSDVTVLFLEDSREGILIGARDFDTWKNAVACPATDARILEARCGEGACGEDTHDVNPHGAVKRAEIVSSRFIIMYGPDYRELLEAYADVLSADRAPRRWEEGVPFGFNSYAGLALNLTEEKFRESGEFIRTELMPKGFENKGTAFINLDGGWQRIPEARMLQMKDEFHDKGQKAGIYDAPFAWFWRDPEAEIPMMPGHRYSEILLRNEAGELLPRVDGAIPYDVTHPVWREWTEKKARRFIDWGYDYLKIDFLSHAGMEGKYHDPAVRTGRQALVSGYKWLETLYAPERTGRPFFLSLSIAPLFPYGYGNARRFSCDAFGLSEDVEYVLNAQTYSWWTGGRLYQYNDPDHIVLQRSFCMLRDSTEGEARARYTSAVIAGSVMLLSEDYSRPGTKERTLRIAGNPEVNRIAKSGTVFRPADSAGGSAAHVFTAKIDGIQYAAVFAFDGYPETHNIRLSRAGLPEGCYEDLWTGRRVNTEEGWLSWNFEGTDAVLLRLV